MFWVVSMFFIGSRFFIFVAIWVPRHDYKRGSDHAIYGRMTRKWLSMSVFPVAFFRHLATPVTWIEDVSPLSWIAHFDE